MHRVEQSGAHGVVLFCPCHPRLSLSRVWWQQGQGMQTWGPKHKSPNRADLLSCEPHQVHVVRRVEGRAFGAGPAQFSYPAMHSIMPITFIGCCLGKLRGGRAGKHDGKAGRAGRCLVTCLALRATCPACTWDFSKDKSRIYEAAATHACCLPWYASRGQRGKQG